MVTCVLLLKFMLYSLAIEPLLAKLRTELQGIAIPKCEGVFKLSAYADDVAILVGSQRDVDTMLKITDDFRIVSSAKVNWEKSVAFLIGSCLDASQASQTAYYGVEMVLSIWGCF